MVKTVIFEKTGGPEVLKFVDITLPPLKNGEVRVRHTAIGLNFHDIEYRRGTIQTPLPATPGFEAAGYVEEVMGNVGDLKVGDRVAYAVAPMGAYCEARNIHHKYLINIPNHVSDQQAAALLFKGMTAHYLVARTYVIRPKIFVLIHAAAGGLGLLLTKLVKYSGGIVIGTVGCEEKVAIAKNNGCDYVIDYSKEDFHKKLIEITNNFGAEVVFDSVGNATYKKSLECVVPFGLMVCVGTSSGKIENFDIESTRENSIFVTAPSIFKYRQNRIEMVLSANEVFDLLAKNVISDNINLKYSFDQVQMAHHDIETRATVGSNIIVL